MKKRVVNILLFFVVCSLLWGIRYVSFNQRISEACYADYVTFGMNETVEYGKNLMNLNENDGYSVKLRSAKLYEFNAFMNDHGIEKIPESIEVTGVPEMICLLTMEIKNTSNALDSVSLGDLSVIYGRDIVLQANEFILDINPELNLLEEYSVCPEIGQSQLVYIPFSLFKKDFSQKDWGALADYPFCFEVTQFPQKQVINIACEYAQLTN